MGGGLVGYMLRASLSMKVWESVVGLGIYEVVQQDNSLYMESLFLETVGV